MTAKRTFACLLLAALCGCSAIGPQTVARDRFDYVSSLSESWKRQMLLNLLKVRYSDAPVFLDVASVINSYTLESQVQLSGQAAQVGRGNTFLGMGASGRYADQPTITYSPLVGDKFAKGIMSPIPVPGILLLVQSGYPADVVLRLCVNTINGLENSFGGFSARAGDPKFHELVRLLRDEQRTGGIALQIKSGNIVLFLRPALDDAITQRHRRISELLGVSSKISELNVIYGSIPTGDAEIAMQSRSMLQVLTELASYIDVPQADVAEGRVHVAMRDAEEQRLFPQPLRVHVSAAAPKDAYAAAHYRGQWFWIDDRDQGSKAVMNFVMMLFALTETGSAQSAPVVTIPAR
jgi:hypothetical protein